MSKLATLESEYDQKTPRGDKHFKLGQAIGVQGTPSIVTEDGRMIPGYLPPQDLLNILDAKS